MLGTDLQKFFEAIDTLMEQRADINEEAKEKIKAFSEQHNIGVKPLKAAYKLHQQITSGKATEAVDQHLQYDRLADMILPGGSNDGED